MAIVIWSNWTEYQFHKLKKKNVKKLKNSLGLKSIPWSTTCIEKEKLNLDT